MNNILKITFAIFLAIGITACSQHQASSLKLEISVAEELQSSFQSEGRLLLYLNETQGREPRRNSGTEPGSYVFGKNISGWDKNEIMHVNLTDEWIGTSSWSLDNIPLKTYYLQIVWDHDRTESRSNAPGNLFSQPLEIDLNKSQKFSIELSDIISERTLIDHELVSMFTLKSNLLSEWWQKPIEIKASVLLPSGFEANPNKKYPVRYNIAGYGGRYTRVSRLINDPEFMNWWTSSQAPQIITVFLDGEGPFGDPYQLDSENNGPYGEALVKELIPAIEKEFRIDPSAETRFVDGCSTGGWVSLALQLFYPETFNGCWSYSPDPVDFRKMQLINIYEDENAFYNKYSCIRPSMRDIYGDPRFSIKLEVATENVQAYSNSYITSGGQWGAWNAVYSPKGEDGLPKAIFDPYTGDIDKIVAEYWKKYDLLDYSRTNWSELGPKIQGKIHIWAGDMDNFYLNNAVRSFDDFIRNTQNPVSDAEIRFSPMEGHCSQYSHRDILEKIETHIKDLNVLK